MALKTASRRVAHVTLLLKTMQERSPVKEGHGDRESRPTLILTVFATGEKYARERQATPRETPFPRRTAGASPP